MKKCNVLLTAVGCPGGVTTVRALKSVNEWDLRIVGVDTRLEAAGRFFCDEFYTVPSGDSESFIPTLLEIIKKENIEVVLPQSSYEILKISKYKEEFEKLDVVVLVADHNAVDLGGDKWKSYDLLADTKVSLPTPILCKSITEFESAVRELGYPEKKVCFKPPYSKGTRGFRILSNTSSRLDNLLYERPDSLYMDFNEAKNIFQEAGEFPDLIVMKYLEGKEFTVDAYCKSGEILCGFVKTREQIRSGLAMYFEVLENDILWQQSKIIVEKLNLDYFVNIQFKGDSLLEINPRISTFVHQDDFNMPFLGIKHALGYLSNDELLQEQNKIRIGRTSVRYFDQFFFDKNNIK